MPADHKWGQAYLTREFFHILGETMPQHVVLATAAEPDSDKLLAGQLYMGLSCRQQATAWQRLRWHQHEHGLLPTNMHRC